MSILNISYNRFVGGEISPLLAARSDYAKYNASCLQLENFLPIVQGPVKKRGGTRFVAETKYSSKKSWLMPFIFSETTARLLEFGDKYIRVFKDGKQIFELESIYSAEDLVNEFNGFNIHFSQAADVIYLACDKYPPQKLSRTKDDIWTLLPLKWPTKYKNPTAVTFFRERLCFANGQDVWMSASDAFEDFEVPATNVNFDDPVAIGVYSEQANQIAWMIPAGNLLVGTSGGEFLIGEATQVDPFGPGNIRVLPETKYGSRKIQPIRIGTEVIFIMRSGRKMMEFAYNFSGDAYSAIDTTIAAEHILKGGVTALAYQAEPDNILWLIREDGLLISCTFNKDQEMNAWARHSIGGGTVEAIAVIPNATTGRDDLYLTVKREIKGELKRYIELLTVGLEEEDSVEKAFYVDSGKTFEFAAPTKTVAGLEHLEGLRVSVLGDGGVQPDVVVKDGAIELKFLSKIVTVGLSYRAFMETVDLELALPDGSMFGKTKRISKGRFLFYRSMGGAIYDENNKKLITIEHRRGNDLMDTQIELLTGYTQNISWPSGNENMAKWTIEHSVPLPLTLVAAVFEVKIEINR